MKLMKFIIDLVINIKTLIIQVHLSIVKFSPNHYAKNTWQSFGAYVSCVLLSLLENCQWSKKNAHNFP